MADLRTFIAIETPESIQAKIAALQDELKQENERVRWPKPANIHLTLKFLGQVEESRTPVITESVKDMLKEQPKFTFSVRGLGAFPNFRRARVLWVGVNDNSDQLQHLVENIEAALIPLGFSKENRKFTPHLTLGRVKSSLSKSFIRKLEQIDFAGGEVTVDEIVLFRSDLKPTGAVYTPLSRFRLK